MFNNQYVIQEEIGNGRMSSVYLASDSATMGKQVALKVLNTFHADEMNRELFNRETTALRRLTHANIVKMLGSDWAASDNSFYIVLDYIPYSLDRYLRDELGARFSNLDPYPLMRQLADALAYAHAEGVIHRDVKPSNILIDENLRPMLTDFGISKLMTHLTIGDTLAGFWSGGYASPEQRAGKTATTASDVYSLGAVFFHLLSRQEPPAEGPTPSMVDEYLDSPRPIRNILKRMLAHNPDDRISSGAELLGALDFIRRFETVPNHFLILTQTAIRDIVATGYSPSENFQDVSEVVLEDLGGMDLEEVHIHRDYRNEDDLIILGGELRFICTPEHDAFVVKAVQTPYMPNLDAEKGRAMTHRAMWMPVSTTFRDEEPSDSLKSASEQLATLLSALDTHQQVGSVVQERRASRREFIERWSAALSKSRNRMEKEASAISYLNVVEESNYLRFTLTESPSDDLDWEEDTPLAVRRPDETRITPVGNLVDIRGRTVEVAKDAGRFLRRDQSIPRTGQLMLNVMEASTSISRQQYAVNSFLYDRMSNPVLARAIIDPSTATRTPAPDLEFFQEWLSDDKKDAVKRAVSSNELFLIQGPPGTGKTSVIAEIVLQILRRSPDARILLTSQSNIAVDHALVQIADAAESAGDSPPPMVRLGRTEKIGYGGESWTLTELAQSWRQEVLNQCNPELDALRKAERNTRRAIKDAGATTDSDGTIEEWIAEAETILEQLEDYEREYELMLQNESLQMNVSSTTKESMEAGVEQTREQLKDQLEALNQLLPQPLEINELSEKDALMLIIRAAATNVGGDDEKDPTMEGLDRIKELQRILTDWTRVVGLTQDFQELIGKSSNVIAATCLFSGNRGRITEQEGNSFDWVIIDEAGRATVPEVLIPIVKAQRMVLVGDERQLPPMLDRQTSEDADELDEEFSLDKSLFQSLVEQVADIDQEHLSTLRTQYRMSPAIGNLISSVFYEGELKNGERTRQGRRALDWMPTPVTWLSTSSQSDRDETRVGASYANSTEAGIVLRLLEIFEEKGRDQRRRPSVGVISGYSAQVEQLITRIDPESSSRWRNLQIEIATVDSFQGRECDIVIYSTVRSNRDRRIGFLRDYRRINVALSRAREILVIVGDNFMMENATIGATANPFASVLDHMRLHGDECRIVQSNTASST